MPTPIVTITYDMPRSEQRRLLDEGIAAGAIVVFYPKPDPEDDDWEYGQGGDPTYHDRYRAEQDDRSYREQIDRWSVSSQEWNR